MEVFLLRLLVPLLILKYPFVGGLITAGLDYFDLNLFLIFKENIGDYQKIDKMLDFYYLSLEAIVVLSWVNIGIKRIALALFFYRALGIILFEITGARVLLFFFPNLFEFFFLLYLFYQGISGKDYLLTKKDKIFFYSGVLIFSSFKIYHEYSLHVLQTEPWPGSEILGILSLI